MTPNQLAKTAAEAIFEGGIRARISLVKRPGHISGFPRGDLLQEKPDGASVYSYPAAKIIAWCATLPDSLYEEPPA